MTSLDVALILLAIAGAYVGMTIGAVSGFFDILGGALGGWAASRFCWQAAGLLGGSASGGYALVFGTVAGALVALGMALSQALERYFLGLMDRFLGSLLGVILSLTLAASLLFPPLLAGRASFINKLQSSAFAPYVMRVSQKYLRLTPPALWERLEPLLDPPEVYRVRKLIMLSKGKEGSG